MGPFVGRAREFTALQQGLERARAGHGATFLIAGEPGIGKTRLMNELAAQAMRQGIPVFWGRCWDRGGAPAFWPWVQILRAAAATDVWPQIAAAAPSWIAEISPLVPEIFPRIPGVPAPGAANTNPEQARFRFFDSVTRALQQLATTSPLVVVLDDLHDADLPSLLLLRFLSREIRQTPILLIGAYRDVTARLSPTLAPVFGQLARECQCLGLAGLRADEVAKLIEAHQGAPLPPAVHADVYRATEGNPFYVDEVSRVWVARHDHPGMPESPAASIRIPESVRAAIRERLAPLTSTTRKVITVAAALGRELELLTLERLISDGTDTFAAIEEACRADILRESEVAGRYTFTHALIRDTLQDDLPVEERARLHFQIAEELKRRRDGATPVRAATLAHHFLLALPAAPIAAAIEYATAAGDEALEQLAYEEAVGHYQTAQRLLDQGAARGEPRAEILLKLGAARRSAGDLVGGRDACQRAAALAREAIAAGAGIEAKDLLARAALGYGRVSETGRVDQDLIRLLEEALSVLAAGDGALRSRVLARLAIALYFSPDRQRGEDYSRAAVAMAERLGDRAAQVHALVALHFTIWGPDSLDERLRVATQVVQHAEAIGERETELEARVWRIADLLEAGEVERGRNEHQAFVGLAERLRFPLYLWYARLQQSMYAAFDGEFALAETLARSALELGQRAALPNAHPFFVSQLLAVRILQGRAGELAQEVAALAEQAPGMAIWRVGHILCLVQRGETETAQRALRRFAEAGFAQLPRDGMWLHCLTLLAHASHRLGDAGGAASLYDLLLPYARRNCMAAFAIAGTGPVARTLGELALLLGRSDEAIEHLEAAAEVLTRMHSRPYLATVRCRLAQAIQTRDPERIPAMLADVLSTARDLGMAELEQSAATLAATTAVPPPRSAPPSPPPTDSTAAADPNVSQFRREGDYWSITLDGFTIRLKDSKGLRYIHRLLGQPGVEIHSIELSRLDAGVVSPAPRRREDAMESVVGDLGDAGEILDAQAIAAYRRRLRDLREEIEEASENNDLGRLAQLQHESDLLLQQLAAGTGLGGRRRRAGAHAEQARVNVTKAIRAALDKIGREDEDIGRRLSASIRTGAFCAYEPDPARPIDWRLA